MAGPILVDQTFSTTGPQGTDEDGHVRTEDNGVYVNREVDYIAGDILLRAGWPSDHIDVAATSFVLDEFLLEDGATWWDSLARLAAFVGYDLWDDEDGVVHLATLGSAASVDDALTADYAYQIGIA
jgi:prophage tail gpP-like protein